MAEKDIWITIPTTDDDGHTIIVTANTDVEKFRSKPKYSIRIEITLDYNSGPLGFPDDADAEMLEKVTDAFHAGLKGQNTAIITGIYTGAGRRNWYSTHSTPGFSIHSSTARLRRSRSSRSKSQPRTIPTGLSTTR